MPHSLESLVRGVVHPMPRAAEIDKAKPDLVKETLGKVSTECIMLTEEVGLKMQMAPIGMFPTYCLLQGTNRMVISYDPGAEMVQLSAVGKFFGHTVGTSLILVDGIKVVAKAHVEMLSTSPTDVDDFTKSTGLDNASAPAPTIEAGAMAGKLISRANPVFPASAKQAHISGKVLLKAIIGRDGRIRSLRVQSAPDGALAMSALQAVRTWTYSPFVLNGHPTEVETTITVNYTFG
jgi:TonB family protein